MSQHKSAKVLVKVDGPSRASFIFLEYVKVAPAEGAATYSFVPRVAHIVRAGI